jgi:hypothetical protein
MALVQLTVDKTYGQHEILRSISLSHFTVGIRSGMMLQCPTVHGFVLFQTDGLHLDHTTQKSSCYSLRFAQKLYLWKD